MIDRETTEAGLAALSVTIASILDEVHDLAITRQASLEDYGEAAIDLAAAGADITVLGAAMKILVRRGEPFR